MFPLRSLVAVAAVVAMTASSANAHVITFDALTTGTYNNTTPASEAGFDLTWNAIDSSVDTLANFGVIAGTTTAAGNALSQLNAGGSTPILTIKRAVSFTFDSILIAFGFGGGGGPAPLVTIEGYLGGGAAIASDNLGGGQAQDNTFRQFTAANLSGVEVDEIRLTYASSAGATLGDFSYLDNIVLSDLTSSTAIPEPSTFGLLGFAAVGCLVHVRRKRAAKIS